MLLCGHHHATVHAGIWTVTIIDGIPWITPPRWIDNQQRPVRNTLPHARHQARTLGHQLHHQQLHLGLDPPHHPDG